MDPERKSALSSSAAFARCAARSGALAVVLAIVACRGTGSNDARGSPATPAASASTGADGSPVLAELDGHVLTLRDFDERLSRQPLALRSQYKNVEARRRLLDDMVRLELLADEARRRGLDRLPEIRDRISELLAEELTNQVLAGDGKAMDVSDAEVKVYYDAHLAEFHSPEERKALVLSFDRRAQADDALRRAASHPRDEAFFRQLGQAEGAEPTRSFDSGFFTQTTSGRLPAPARDAVFEMHNVGEVHPIVANDGTFYVLMLTGIRPAIVREPKDVATLVRERLRAERRSRAVADFIDGLRSRANARIHPERLGAPGAPATAPSTPTNASRTD